MTRDAWFMVTLVAFVFISWLLTMCRAGRDDAPTPPFRDRKPHDTERGRMFIKPDGNGYRED